MSSTLETVVEGQVSELPESADAALAAPGPGVYVSPWTQDSNTNDHTTVFEHGLGSVPLSLKAFFTGDTVTVYPLLWSWSVTGSGNPVSVIMTANTITLSITASQPLHGAWTPMGGWASFTSGYWKVIASTTA